MRQIHLVVPSQAMLTVLQEYGVTTPAQVIPTGIRLEQFRQGDGERFRERFAIPWEQPLLLYVGRVAEEKNIPFLIDVFEQLTDFDGRLVIAGMRGWKYEPILERIRTSTRADRIQFLEYVADADLPALYGGADLFVFPSHYEGFGLPPLEAMACGTPAVSSSGGSLAEVLGDDAVVLDTFDIERWTAEIRQVLSDTGRRDRLAEAGRRRAAGYTWDRTAGETWKVYERVLA